MLFLLQVVVDTLVAAPQVVADTVATVPVVVPEDSSIIGQMIATFFDGLEFVGPTLVAILTVPLFALVKRYQAWVGNLPSWVQQMIVVAVAGTLTWIGTLLNVVLPTDLSVFGEPEISTLLSAAMAYGIHAGRRVKE